MHNLPQIIDNTVSFLNDLKRKVEKILGYKIRQDVLSRDYLGQTSRHYEYVKNKASKDITYRLLKDVLVSYENNLKSKLKEDYRHLSPLFKNYHKNNNIPSKRFKIFKYHPNMNLDFFKKINTVEKAYWYGFLLADGSLFLQKGNRVLSIEVNVNDGIIIRNYIRVIGFNPKYVKYYKRIYINKKGERKIRRTFRARFTSDDFTENLISYGFIIGKKSAIIRFPGFKNPEFQLACILGFFDGDGSHVGTPTIYSRSRAFLEDIKKVAINLGYSNKFKISERLEVNEETGKEYSTYYLGLGGEMFNDMLEVYLNSLQRKRVSYLTGESMKEFRRKHWLSYLSTYKSGKKFKYSKEQLFKLRVQKKLSFEKIAQMHKKEFGEKISYHTVRYWCTKWDQKINGINTESNLLN